VDRAEDEKGIKNLRKRIGKEFEVKSSGINSRDRVGHLIRFNN